MPRRVRSFAVAAAFAGPLLLAVALAAAPRAAGIDRSPQLAGAPAGAAGPSLDRARHLFYSGRYSDASAMALALREAHPDDLATYELRTSAIHFQLRRLIGDPEDKDKVFKACAECAPLMAVFMDDFTHGRSLAKNRLERTPDDIETLFFLGKLDLNYIWLQLGTLGHRTGWNEYREARHSLDDVLKMDPRHVRARVARAWIDYIVDTRVKWGFRWILGGGDKKKALRVMNETAATASDHFERTEAAFGLWEMNIREKNMPKALAIAKTLARDFPDNRELAKFISAQNAAPAASVQE
jgi:hypothetical protein